MGPDVSVCKDTLDNNAHLQRQQVALVFRDAN